MPDLKRGQTELIIAVARAEGLLRNELAYVLATTWHETNATMEPVQEAYWLSEDWRRRNLRYYPWHGRGFVQLTWEENYRRATRETGVDLISDPAKAMEPSVAAKVLVKGMAQGWFTGKKLSDYITLQRSDFAGARRIVNGTDRAEKIAAYAREYDQLLKEARYGEHEEPAPPEPEDTHDHTEAMDALAAARDAIDAAMAALKA